MSIKKISALLLAVLLIASTAVFSVSAVSRSYSYIYNYALKVKMDISSTGEKSRTHITIMTIVISWQKKFYLYRKKRRV